MRGAVMYGPGDVRVEERRFLPDLMQLIWDRKIDAGKVFDPHPPIGSGRRGLQGDGRAPRHEGAADSVSREA
jgi:hypothetical protein